MPIEALALTMQACPFAECPKCNATPFTPLMRGEVWRSWFSCWDGWKAAVFGRPFDYCAVICGDCRQIVGYERPHDLSALMIAYDKAHGPLRKFYQ